MTTFVVPLVCAFIAISIGTFMLHKRVRILNTKEQSYKFHEFRDKLQLLLVDGAIEKESKTYQFLQFTVNMAIRNAGAMKLSEILRLAKAINKKANVVSPEQIFEDIRRHNEEVQQLAAGVFYALGKMLISNDDFTFFLAKVGEALAHKLRGAFQNVAKNIIRAMMPERSKAIHESTRYKNWGHTLSPQHLQKS